MVAILLVMVRHARSNAVAAALGLVVGGALGNLSDRVFRSHHGAVVDFIALHFWPTFNVADSCVVVGGFSGALLWRSQPQQPQRSSPSRRRPGLRAGRRLLVLAVVPAALAGERVDRAHLHAHRVVSASGGRARSTPVR